MRYLLAIFILALLAIPAHANDGAPREGKTRVTQMGGFQGPISGAMAETVEKAKTLPNKSRVMLTGNIVSKLAGSRDEYVFKDSTGEMVIEIAPKRFGGNTVTPQNQVRVSGKMAKESHKDAELDVSHLEVLK